MKQFYFLYGLLFFQTSCNLFNTEKISTETFYEEGVKDITWNEIDTYPVFPACSSNIEKLPQQECFLKAIQSSMQNLLTTEAIATPHQISDTLQLRLAVNVEGKIHLTEMKADSTLLIAIPQLKAILNSGIEVLPTLQPATKQGIPVSTQFTIPIVIQSKSATN